MPALVATTIAFLILLALGDWQLHRRSWKLGMLAAIDRSEAGPPVPLQGVPAPFTKVVVTGTLLPNRALYGVDVRERLDGPPQIGAQLVGLLTPPHGKPVLVDFGWIPAGDGAPDPLHHRLASAAPVTIEGYIRAPDHPTWLSAADDPSTLRFYTLDPNKIAAALGAHDVAPFTLVALGQPSAPGAPVPADALPRPPNNHLQYAFTWFGLAATLIAVFVAWVRDVRRKAHG